ncbi:uncharacterized protein LOC120174157 [Hibiscus syriacus]|nr:uncharacterized protein LOC120174157 [Hibiscus syriacus]
MYSKADSEAEYMDLKTLWDRTNDAINTIIKREESTETGELLPPCIEAALNLDCTPRRTLRSQRNCNLRCYLYPGPQEAEGIARGNVTENSHCTASYSGIAEPTTMNVTHLGFASENGSLASNNPCLPNLYSVFPLFNGNHLRFEVPWHDFGVFPKSISNAVEPAKTSYIHNVLFSDADSSNASKNPHGFSCDLSLRLGPISTPCSSVGNDQAWETGKSLSSFLWGNGDDPSNSTSNERSFEGENEDTTSRKRKTIYGGAAD